MTALPALPTSALAATACPGSAVTTAVVSTQPHPVDAEMQRIVSQLSASADTIRPMQPILITIVQIWRDHDIYGRQVVETAYFTNAELAQERYRGYGNSATYIQAPAVVDTFGNISLIQATASISLKSITAIRLPQEQRAYDESQTLQRLESEARRAAQALATAKSAAERYY